VTEEELAALVRVRIAEAHAWLNNPTLDRPDVTAMVWIERYAANAAALLAELDRQRAENADWQTRYSEHEASTTRDWQIVVEERDAARNAAEEGHERFEEAWKMVAAMRPIVEAVATDSHYRWELQELARTLLAKEGDA
jgi:hypothetical protein